MNLWFYFKISTEDVLTRNDDNFSKLESNDGLVTMTAEKELKNNKGRLKICSSEAVAAVNKAFLRSKKNFFA